MNSCFKIIIPFKYEIQNISYKHEKSIQQVVGLPQIMSEEKNVLAGWEKTWMYVWQPLSECHAVIEQTKIKETRSSWLGLCLVPHRCSVTVFKRNQFGTLRQSSHVGTPASPCWLALGRTMSLPSAAYTFLCLWAPTLAKQTKLLHCLFPWISETGVFWLFLVLFLFYFFF